MNKYIDNVFSWVGLGALLLSVLITGIGIGYIIWG